MSKRKKRADGLYQANIVVGTDPKTGKYIRKQIYGKDEKEVSIKAAKIQDAIRKGTYADDKKITLQEYAYSWLERYKANPELENPMDSHTYRDYKNIIKNHLGPLKDMRLQKIQKQDILEAIALLNGHYDLQRRLRMTVNQILEAAIDEGLLYKNVCRNIKISKKPKSSQRKFTAEEIAATMSVLPDLDPQQRILMLLLYYTGARRGEILALQKQDILLQKKEISISKAVTFPVNQALFGPPKSQAGIRKIEILPPLQEELLHYIQKCETSYLFPGSDDRVISLAIFRRMWNKIRNKVENRYDTLYPGLAGTFDAEGYTPHRFRHNFCSMLHDAGVPAIDAQKIMGHSDVSVTLGIYTHFDEDKAVQMSGRMNKLLEEQTAALEQPLEISPSNTNSAQTMLNGLDPEMYKQLIAGLAEAVKSQM